MMSLKQARLSAGFAALHPILQTYWSGDGGIRHQHALFILFQGAPISFSVYVAISDRREACLKRVGSGRVVETSQYPISRQRRFRPRPNRLWQDPPHRLAVNHLLDTPGNGRNRQQKTDQSQVKERVTCFERRRDRKVRFKKIRPEWRDQRLVRVRMGFMIGLRLRCIVKLTPLSQTGPRDEVLAQPGGKLERPISHAHPPLCLRPQTHSSQSMVSERMATAFQQKLDHPPALQQIHEVSVTATHRRIAAVSGQDYRAVIGALKITVEPQ